MEEKSPVKIFVIAGSAIVVLLLILIIAFSAGGKSKNDKGGGGGPSTNTVTSSNDNGGKIKLKPGKSGFDDSSDDDLSSTTKGTDKKIDDPRNGDYGGNNEQSSKNDKTDDNPVITTPTSEVDTEPSSKSTDYSVKKTLSSIGISSMPSKTKYYIGDKVNLNGIAVTAYYSDGSKKNVTSSISYQSPDMNKAGSASVTVKYNEGTITKTVTYPINIKKPYININQREKSIYVGKTTTLTASFEPSNCTVKWSSASNKIASVSQTGVVKGVDTGRTTVTASITYNGITYNSDGCLIAVTKMNSNITISNLGWEGQYDSSGLYVDTIYGSITSNYDLTYIEVGLSGPAYVNNRYVEDYTKYIYLEETELSGKRYDLEAFGSCDFDIILGEEYFFYVYAEDANGGSYMDGWSWQEYDD